MKIQRIRGTLIQAFALVILVICIVLGTISLYFIQHTLTENSQESTQQLISQLNRIMDSYIGYMDDISRMALDNEDTGALMSRAKPGPELKQRVATFIKSLKTVRRDIESIFLIKDGLTIVSSNPERPINPYLPLEKPMDYQSNRKPGNLFSVSAARVDNTFADQYSWVISLIRETAGPPWAMVQVNLNYAVIEDLCRKIQLGNSGYIFIVNGNGEIVYHPRQQLIHSGLRAERIDRILELRNGSIPLRIKDRDLFYTFNTSEQTGWTVVAVNYLDEIFYNNRDMQYIYLMVTLASFLVTVFISWAVARKMSRPIEELRKTMQVVETGNFNLDITVNAKNEVFELARDFDITVKKIRDLVAQSQREQEIKRKQDLLLLQSQINPHFLYNTLDSIIWLVELGQNQAAVEMISALAKFFRLGISAGNEIITIGDEIEHIHSYLTIQKMRYQTQLEFEIEVDPGIRKNACLKLLLQPLVENAIYHGIKNRASPGLIRIEGFQVDGTVVFRVRDNGVGMDPQILNRLSEVNSNWDSFEKGHIGIRNVHERIRLYFGDPFGLHFESTPGKGTVVTIIIPQLDGEAA